MLKSLSGITKKEEKENMIAGMFFHCHHEANINKKTGKSFCPKNLCGTTMRRETDCPEKHGEMAVYSYLHVIKTILMKLSDSVCAMLIAGSLILAACSRDESALIITTKTISGVTTESAFSGVEIVYGTDDELREVGLVWDISRDPATGKNSGRSSFKPGKRDFIIEIENLEPETIYYVRAYGINNSGTFYGDERSFKTYYGKVDDIDGNTSYTVRIGRTEWMAANIRTGRYKNGDEIPIVSDNNEWSGLSSGAGIFYDLDDELGKIYGYLYNWYAISDERGLCPAGWTVPEDFHWKELEMELGMSRQSADRAGLRDRYAGGKLKETGISHWLSPNVLATDIHGFKALPGGYRHLTGPFASLGISSNWWTSTSYNVSDALYRNIYHENGGIYRSTLNKISGLSVRCIKVANE
jgi:uncharacterized protein (TIGR02145 family)